MEGDATDMSTELQRKLIARFFKRGQPISLSKGEIVVGNSETTNGVYFIDTGYVKIYSISNEGDQYLHIIYGPGELFPLVWAYLGIETKTLFYETISECVIWRMSREWFTSMLTTDTELARAFSLQLARQFQASIVRIDNLEYKKASERVAYRLLFLASRFGIREGTAIRIDVPITHELLASSVNLARESVSREIEALEKEHLIDRRKHHFRIIDAAGLMDKFGEPPDFQNWNLH